MASISEANLSCAIFSFTMPSSRDNPGSSNPSEGEWLALVRAHLEKLKYGVVQLVVHDGRVIQVECTQKTRLAPEASSSGQTPKR
jgi:hypothetical protein